MKIFLNVFFGLAVVLWLYSCSSLLEIDKLRWRSVPDGVPQEVVNE